MSDEIENEVVEEKKEAEEQEVEQKQAKSNSPGHISREEWISKGRDADEWMSERLFKDRTSMIGQIKTLRDQMHSKDSEIEQRLENQKQFQKAQMDIQLNELRDKQRKAVEDADTDEFDKIQGRIDDINKIPQDIPVVKANSDEDLLKQYNLDNQWLTENTPKAAYAIAQYERYSRSGQPVQQAIQSMEESLKKQFPEQNERRNQARTVEGGSNTVKKTAGTKMKWGDLNAQELKVYEATRSAWKDKAEFLQAAQDDRG